MLGYLNVLIYVAMEFLNLHLMVLTILVMMGMMMIMMDVQALVENNLILNVNLSQLIKMIQIQNLSVNVII